MQELKVIHSATLYTKAKNCGLAWRLSAHSASEHFEDGWGICSDLVGFVVWRGSGAYSAWGPFGLTGLIGFRIYGVQGLQVTAVDY